MRKLLLILPLLIGMAYAQITQVARRATIAQLKAYNGTATVVYVSDSTNFYITCSPCTADEVYIFAGAGTKKWKRLLNAQLSTLNAKQNAITLGTTLQYFRGDLSLATFPTNNSSFSNGAGYLVAADITGKANLTGGNNFSGNQIIAAGGKLGIGLAGAPVEVVDVAGNVGLYGTYPYWRVTSLGAAGTWYVQFGINLAAGAAGNYLSFQLPASKGLAIQRNGVTAFLVESSTAAIGIGTETPAASSITDMVSTTKGFLPPRMTTTQRNAISSPATGLTIFCTDCTATDASTGVMQTYNGSAWKNYW